MTASQPNIHMIMNRILEIIEEAGETVMEIYRTDFEARTKSDSSPVTEADLAAEAIITPALEALLPNVPVVAEEAAAEGRIPEVSDGYFWLVDPVDGTKEFLNRNDEFTVNIALLHNRQPVLGAVLAPALDTLYWGIVDEKAWKRTGQNPPEEISVRSEQPEGITLAASRRHGDPALLEKFLAGRPLKEVRNAGSSLKFCLVACGEADLYPRFGPTCEWDTAAGHAVLQAAGGRITLEDGKTPFTYAKRKDFLNPHFIAWGGIK
ncbi:3'(2'),5'-bisphosphate nucleotidase CysQ [Aestuariispira insulae]|uniref:3'(2'),5'-bisphosphate nucleotidase CysQ n=1 Tax=Aestuariispira insulae TaxID=1461337 RepID=A0A3D9HK57_9PROT|nr:3'(2'),5'-bisphosphate nucleotidase CysQ [Aestuariispira insulae]RED49805.1 3'(2'),5'-bisphosphate nucleotidase [Aestuariispira insulae]